VSDETVHRVTLRHVRDFEFSATFEGVSPERQVLLDERPPLGEGRGPNPSSLLAAAVGNCLAASLLFCLKKSRADITGVDASAEVHISKNEAGRLRISHIDVDVTPEFDHVVSADEASRLARCGTLFEEFCTVTQSIRQGIVVNVRVGVPEGATL